MIIAVKIASCCTFYKCTSVFFVQCCTCFITCHGRLEPRVVITRHLVSPEVVTSVFVVIVLVRSTHKGALQHVRIRVRAVVIVPVTNCRRAVAGTAEMKKNWFIYTHYFKHLKQLEVHLVIDRNCYVDKYFNFNYFFQTFFFLYIQAHSLSIS